MSDLHLGLNPKQLTLFRKLKSAYKACQKANIIFVNNYGLLEAYDKALVDDYTGTDRLDRNDDNVISSHDTCGVNYFNITNEWADDEHLIKLTPKGVKLLNE